MGCDGRWKTQESARLQLEIKWNHPCQLGRHVYAGDGLSFHPFNLETTYGACHITDVSSYKLMDIRLTRLVVTQLIESDDYGRDSHCSLV